MSIAKSKLKVKICIGDDPNKIFKAFSSFPNDYSELYKMTQKKVNSLLGYHEEMIYIYYHDSLYGKIHIENDDDFRGAIDHCYMCDYKSLKLYIYTYPLTTQMARSRQDFDEYNYESDEGQESENESDKGNDQNEHSIQDKNNTATCKQEENIEDKLNNVCKITQSTYSDNIDDNHERLCQNDDESEDDEQDGSPQFLKYEENGDTTKEPSILNNFEDDSNVNKIKQKQIKNNDKQMEDKSNTKTDNSKPKENKSDKSKELKQLKTMTKNKEEKSKTKIIEEKKGEDEEEKVEKKAPNKRKHNRMKYQCVFQPPFLLKMPINVDKEVKKNSAFSIFSSKIKNSIFGMNEEDADRLMRVDETELDLSNQDVILAKPGCLVKKTWRIKNLGIKEWPKDSKIVSVTEGLYYHPPKITSLLKPGEVMDIGIRIYIPKEEKDEGNLKEYIMRLYSEHLKCFGEPLIATIQVDSQLYDQILSTLPKDSDEYEFPRVTNDLKYTANYQSAKELSEQKEIPYKKCLKQILKSNNI